MGRIITLITDYGWRDHYVGVLHGVILRIAPDVRIVDVTHAVEPHDITHGAFVLRQVLPWYPAGTIHMAVVDPGVGTDRRILVAQYGGQFIVTPDNGLLTFVHRDLPAEEMVSVENRHFFLSKISSTFHGRDMIAPVASHLANGVRPREFGRVTDRLEILPISWEAERTSSGLCGQVIYVDRFGTLVSNVQVKQLESIQEERGNVSVFVNGENIGSIKSTFSDVPIGKPVAFVGGSGNLEIAVNQGRAVDRFSPDAEVCIEVR